MLLYVLNQFCLAKNVARVVVLEIQEMKIKQACIFPLYSKLTLLGQ